MCNRCRQRCRSDRRLRHRPRSARSASSRCRPVAAASPRARRFRAAANQSDAHQSADLPGSTRTRTGPDRGSSRPQQQRWLVPLQTAAGQPQAARRLAAKTHPIADPARQLGPFQRRDDQRKRALSLHPREPTIDPHPASTLCGSAPELPGRTA